MLKVRSYYGLHSSKLGKKNTYYIDKSVLLGTKPLVDSLHHFIRDLSGVFFLYVTFVSVVSSIDIKFVS